MSEEAVFDDISMRLKHCIQLSKERELLCLEVKQNVSENNFKGSSVKDGLVDSVIKDVPANTEDCLKKPTLSKRPPGYIKIVVYEDERQMGSIMRLITKDLSEPYSIYTYRYFIHNWPSLCFLALNTEINDFVGAIVCKLDKSRRERRRGYIAMLAVDESCRKLGIGTCLVEKAIANMRKMGCDEVVLETEVTNVDAMRLYSNLGFIREKRLFRYYLNGVDAFRLKLFFTAEPDGFRFHDTFY